MASSMTLIHSTRCTTECCDISRYNHSAFCVLHSAFFLPSSQQRHQLVAAQRDWALIGTGKTEDPALQPLCVQNQAVAVEEQHLDPVGLAITKYELITAQRIATQCCADHFTQRVEALAANAFFRGSVRMQRSLVSKMVSNAFDLCEQNERIDARADLQRVEDCTTRPVDGGVQLNSVQPRLPSVLLDLCRLVNDVAYKFGG